MLPEDTYAVSESDINLTCTENFTLNSVENMREQYPQLTEDELKTLCGVDAESPSSTSKGDIRDRLTEYMPWQDVKDSLMEIIQDMEPNAKEVLLEMNKAHESSAFLSNTSTKLKHLPSTPTEVFNVADGFVRRIIKVAKQLEYFRAMEKDDQIALLKGSVVEIMMLRSSVNFDVKTETWNLSTISCIKPNSSSTASSPSSCENQSTDSPIVPAGLNIDELRKAAMNGADMNTLRNMARQGSAPPNVDELRKAAQSGMDLSKLKSMARQGMDSVEQNHGTNLNAEETDLKSNKDKDLAGLDGLRNAAKAAGFDVDALRKAAMNGASFSQLSQMAHSSAEGDNENSVNSSIKQESDSSNQSESGSNTISSDILKHGNTETKTFFLTYSKFIRSLMSTIYGDLIVLKFLIMLSLFSPDRQGLENRAQVDTYQEIYANCLRKYIEVRFPNAKNMFARCIMKLTDLRNVNEVHTKMLLKMQVTDIEPLLVEIFDLPT